MTPYPLLPFYQFVVCYPLAIFPDLDEPIRVLALKYGGAEVGSGAGMGQRDLVFEFADLNEPTFKFISEVLKLCGIEITISAIEPGLPLANS